MENAATYEAIREGSAQFESWMVASLPGRLDLSPDRCLERLRKASMEVLQWKFLPPRLPSARFELRVHLAQEDSQWECNLWLDESSDLDASHFEWHGMDERDVSAALRSPWSMGVGQIFHGSPTASYHRQMQTLAALAPEATAFLDVSALRPRPAQWLSDMAVLPPPSPTNLFSIHAVSDEDPNRPFLWLHTHGLLRCHCIELEMSEISPEDLPLMGDLLNATAAFFMDQGVPPVGEVFQIGEHLNLLWLPWEERTKILDAFQPGGSADRDEEHSHPSGFLFTPNSDPSLPPLSPSRLAPFLADDPVFYVSQDETDRMKAIARRLFPRFHHLFFRYGGREGWSFLAKLGLEAHEFPEEKEHLWFEVHRLEGGEMEGTLVNAPVAVNHLAEGHRSCQSLDYLTEWTIMTPYGSYGPDSLVFLERLLVLEESRIH